MLAVECSFINGDSVTVDLTEFDHVDDILQQISLRTCMPKSALGLYEHGAKLDIGIASTAISGDLTVVVDVSSASLAVFEQKKSELAQVDPVCRIKQLRQEIERLWANVAKNADADRRMSACRNLYRIDESINLLQCRLNTETVPLRREQAMVRQMCRLKALRPKLEKLQQAQDEIRNQKDKLQQVVKSNVKEVVALMEDDNDDDYDRSNVFNRYDVEDELEECANKLLGSDSPWYDRSWSLTDDDDDYDEDVRVCDGLADYDLKKGRCGKAALWLTR